MKKLKFLSFLLFVVMLSVNLTSCGDENDEPGTSNNEEQSSKIKNRELLGYWQYGTFGQAYTYSFRLYSDGTCLIYDESYYGANNDVGIKNTWVFNEETNVLLVGDELVLSIQLLDKGKMVATWQHKVVGTMTSSWIQRPISDGNKLDKIDTEELLIGEWEQNNRKLIFKRDEFEYYKSDSLILSGRYTKNGKQIRFDADNGKSYVTIEDLSGYFLKLGYCTGEKTSIGIGTYNYVFD